MKVGKIIPCVCTQEPDFTANGYAGMPILRTYGGADTYFDAKCPQCGRGGLFQFKSAYLALRYWNKMQGDLRKQLEFICISPNEPEIGGNRQ